MGAENINKASNYLHVADQLGIRLNERSLDMSISYPRYISHLHGPLSDFVLDTRKKAEGKIIDRDEQIERIACFYGYAGDTVVAVTSAGESLHTVLQYFTKSGTQIFIPNGSYARFPDFIESLAGGRRSIQWVNANDLSNLVEDTPENLRRKIVLLEEPNDTTFITPGSEVYHLVSMPGTFGAVIYDAINWPYNKNTLVIRENNSNRLYREVPFPKSDSSIRIVSASKILPSDQPVNPFPNVGIIAINDSVDVRARRIFEKCIPRKHFQSPSTADLFVMAELLHSDLFPEFIKGLRRTAKKNYQYVRSVLGTQVIPDGLNVFVQVNLGGFDLTSKSFHSALKAFGLNALYYHLFFRRSANVYYTSIRMPIIMEQVDLEKLTQQLKEKLGNIARINEIIRQTPFAP